jgi:hypothetical protein
MTGNFRAVSVFRSTILALQHNISRCSQVPLLQQPLRYISTSQRAYSKRSSQDLWAGFRHSSTMSRPTVLLIGPLTHCNQEWSDLGKKYTLKEFRTGSRDDFLSKCKQGEYDDVVGLYRSNNSVTQTGPFDQQLLSSLPKSLKYICHNGAGYDNIDVDAFTQRGISISSTPIAVDDSTADTGIFLMLGALRQAQIPLDAIRAGKWRGKTPIGHDPKGKVLGILGMGGIGRVCSPTVGVTT